MEMNKKERVATEEKILEKQVIENKPARALRRRKATAMAGWFSFHVGGSLQAAQNDQWNSAAPAVLETVSGVTQSVGGNDSFLATSSGIAIIAVSLIGFTLLSYSLITAGKRGWGWLVLCFAGGVILIFARLGVSLFNEISSPNSVQDWDN